MSRFYLGVDPGGSPGLALVEHNTGFLALKDPRRYTDYWRPSDERQFVLHGHTFLKDWAKHAAWRPWEMLYLPELPSWLRMLPCKMENLEIVLERQRAWGPGDGGTKLIIAYACLAAALSRHYQGAPQFRALEPRTWEKMVRERLTAVDKKPPKNKKLFTEAATIHFFGHCPPMTQHERDAALLGVCGGLADSQAERVLDDLHREADLE